MNSKFNNLRATVPYEKDVNSEKVLRKKADILSKGGIITNIEPVKARNGPYMPPGIGIFYKIKKRNKPIY